MVSDTQVIRYRELNSDVDVVSYHAIEKHWRQQDFAASIANNDMILFACDNQSIIGHIIQRGCLDSWDILDFFVVEKQRRQGVGQALIENLQQQIWAFSPASIFLEVASNNFTAQKLYTKNNFVIVGERKGYYQQGRSNAIQMRWSC